MRQRILDVSPLVLETSVFPRKHDLGRALRRAIVAFATTLFAFILTGSAGAEDSPIIQVKESGSVEPFPLGKAFRAEGAVTDDEQVDLVFIRSAYRAFGVVDPSALDCSTLQEKLSAGGRFPSFAPNAPVGATEVGALWANASTLLGGSYSAYRATPWKRSEATTEDGKKKFSLLVPADPFFRGGAQYCSLLLRRNRPPIVARDVEQALSAFVEAWSAHCEKPGRGKDAEQACTAASAALSTALSDQLGGEPLSAADQALLDKAIAKLKGGLLDARDARADLQKIAVAWPSIVKPGETRIEPLHFFSVEEPLGALTTALLARSHALLAAVEKTSTPDGKETTKLVYYTDDAKLEVVEIAFTERFDKIFARGRGPVVPEEKKGAVRAAKGEKAPSKEGPRASVELPLGPGALKLPGVELTLLDLLQLSQGKIKYESGHATPSGALGARLGAELNGNALKADRQKVQGLLDPMITWLDGIEATLLAGSPGSADGPRPGTAADPGAGLVNRSAGAYLRGLLKPCSDIAEDARGGVCAASACEDKGPKGSSTKPSALWPGFYEPDCAAGPPRDTGPIFLLRSALGSYLGGVTRAQEGFEQLKNAKGLLRTQVATSPAQRLELTSDAWFGQYVVTTVGFARVTGASDPFWVNYYGFKLYPFPNRVDEPKWIGSTGLGFYRLLAVELAFVPSVQALEAAPRFNGLQKGAIPPILLGASIQALPYLTVSGGAVFLDHRSTVLGVETSRLFVSPYFAFAADVNILDAVATGLQKGRNTTISGVIR